MSLKLDPANCIGCRLCQLACSATKEGVFNPELARLKIVSVYDESGLNIKSSVCTLCLACVSACPAEAIAYENERLSFRESACTDCGLCLGACPEGIIKARPHGVALCDLCGGTPECVEWCPHNALTNAEVG